MRIIGGKDYYDGASYGVDNDVVFVRNQEEILFPEQDLPLHINTDLSYYSRRDRNKALNLVYVFFAGEVYPALRVIEAKKSFYNSNPHVGDYENIFDWSKYAWEYHNVDFIYDYDEALQIVENYSEDTMSFLGRERKKDIYEHFNYNKNITSWMIENRIVTGLLHRKSSGPSIARDSKNKTLRYVQMWNGDFMHTLQFFKVKDAFTANQEISMYVGGVLPKPGAQTVELNNEERIQKAGFDLKVSFRNM